MRRIVCTVAVAIALCAVPSVSRAGEPIWAKKATGFRTGCFGERDLKSCLPIKIPSPDGNSSIEIMYRKRDDTRSAYLLVRGRDGKAREVEQVGDTSSDVLWAPDSKAFFVSGSNGGATTGMFLRVFRIDDPELRPIDVTRSAQRDMVRNFPPCKAANVDDSCHDTEQHPEFNISGVDWVKDSSAVVVMAEVPCTSFYGGIMCQVLGYELEVPTGKILKRMNAREFRARWQASMAWRFRVPEPPEYEH